MTRVIGAAFMVAPMTSLSAEVVRAYTVMAVDGLSVDQFGFRNVTHWLSDEYKN